MIPRTEWAKFLILPIWQQIKPVSAFKVVGTAITLIGSTIRIKWLLSNTNECNEIILLNFILATRHFWILIIIVCSVVQIKVNYVNVKTSSAVEYDLFF